jgi:hypothetical protein
MTEDTCRCEITYHHETNQRGQIVAVWDSEPLTTVEIMAGRCAKCGLPLWVGVEIFDPDDAQD